MNVPDAQAAVEALFNPRSITILGASEAYDKWGTSSPATSSAAVTRGSSTS